MDNLPFQTRVTSDAILPVYGRYRPRMTKQDVISVFERARDLVGRSYKQRIWRVWFSEKYAAEGLAPLETDLRIVFTAFGPPILGRIRLKMKAKDVVA